MSDLENKTLRVVIAQGHVYDVPVMAIAESAAAYYAKLYGGDVNAALDDEVRPLFEDDYEISSWASGNMNWDEIQDVAIRVPDSSPPIDFQEGWVNGEKEILAETNDEGAE